MDYILKCSDMYYGLSITEVRKLAFQFAKKLEIQYPHKWDDEEMAGRKWFAAFLNRHPTMSLRTPQQVSVNRIRGFSQANVDLFFSNLDRVTDEDRDGHIYGAHQIWNMDETGFSTVPTKIGRVVLRKGSKHVGAAAAQERGTLVTMAACINAAGTVLPPFWVFPRQKMRSIFLEHATEGSAGAANGSGWMKQPEFLLFMRHFIRYTGASVLRPQLLIVDNHESHLSVDAIDLARESGITMLSFPPHCSHKMQPLDVSVFGPLKACYKKQCAAWTKNNVGRVLEIHHIPEIVAQKEVMDTAFTPANIKAGFRATGKVFFTYFLLIFIDIFS